MDDRIALSLEPDECLVWEGRPSPGRLGRASLPKAIVGLFMIVFTLSWCWFVIQGNGNGWDGMKDVGPFRPHNVAIALGAGLWMTTPGLIMLLSPLRAVRRARMTSYAVTDRRALIIEPDRSRGNRTRSLPPDDLALEHCRERADGSGDLVFGNDTSRVGTLEPFGFLGIDHVRDVEAILRRQLMPQPVGGLITAWQGWVEAPTELSDAVALPATYSLPFFPRCRVVAFSVVVLLVLVMIALDILVIPVVVALGVLPLAVFPRPLATLVTLFVLPLFCRIILAATRRLLRIPVAIAVQDDGDLTLRGLLYSRTIPIRDLIAIRTGGWGDPNCFQVVLEHKAGKVSLINRFTDFRRFLLTIRSLNPRVEITGF